VLPDRFVRYEQWSLLSRGATRSSHPIGATEGVSLHWEGPRMGAFEHTACAEKVRGIQRYHRETKNWADIAYNGVVCPHGWIFEGRGAGVTSAANGDTGPNDTHYAVCYLGGEGDGFTDDGKAGFHNAVQWLRSEGDAGPEVNGHRDHKATDCPGDLIYGWLRRHDFDQQEDDDMTPEDRQLLEETHADVKRLLRRDEVYRATQQRRFQRILAEFTELEEQGADDATAQQVRRLRKQLEELRDELAAGEPTEPAPKA
jgi:uncharacterized protein YdcH (DUF465 family)